MELASVKDVTLIHLKSFSMWDCDNVCKVYGKMLAPYRYSRKDRKYY